MNDVGKKIKDLRKQKGLTQRELGALLHVSFQAVSKWERGDSLPDTAMFGDVAQVLGVSVDDLFYQEGDLSLIDGQQEGAPKAVVRTEIIEKPVYRSVNRKKYIIITACAVIFIAVLAVLISSSVIKKNGALEKIEALSTAYFSQSNLKIECKTGERSYTFVRKYYFDGRVVLYFFDGENEKYYYQGEIFQKLVSEQAFVKSVGDAEDFLASIPKLYTFDFDREKIKKIRETGAGFELSLKNGAIFKWLEDFGFSHGAKYFVELNDGVLEKITVKEGEKVAEIQYAFGYDFTFAVPKF